MFQQPLFELAMQFSILLENRKSKNVVISYIELTTLSAFSQSDPSQIRKTLMDAGLKPFLNKTGKPWTTTEYVEDWLLIHCSIVS